MAIKNTAITVTYVAWNTSTNAGQTGDAANHTLKVVQDGTEANPTNSPTEVDSTNCPGLYKLALTAGDMNFNCVALGGKSSTANVAIIPLVIVTERGNINAGGNLPGSANGLFIAGTNAATTVTTSFTTTTFSGNLSGSVGSVIGSVGSISGVTFPGNFAAMVIDASGRVDIGKILGTNSAGTAGTVAISTAQLLAAPRDMSAVADSSLTVNDALWSAVAAGPGQKDASSGTSMTLKTPSTGTLLRTFTITTASAPTTVPTKIV